MLTGSLLYLFFSLSFSAPCDSNLPSGNISELYDKSYQVVTGFLTNKYKSSTTFNPDGNNMVEFEVTEIQKGPRRQKILTYTSDADSLQTGSEYLVFLEKNKKGSSGRIIGIYRVCHHCDNLEIKEVYSIVKKKLFRKVKPPLPAYTIGEGCGC